MSARAEGCRTAGTSQLCVAYSGDASPGGCAEASGDAHGVAEADGSLDRPLDAPLCGGDGEALEAVLGVSVRRCAEALLELRQVLRAAGVAHVVGAAPRAACVLDGELQQEVVGPAGCGVLVHRGTEV